MLEIVYYFDKISCLCPVKKYLEKYVSKEAGCEKKMEKKKRILISIREKIEFVRQNEGRPIPPISSSFQGYSFFEIRARKDKNILIRITYFRHDCNIVLLNAFEKPDNYETNRDKKLVEKQLMVADTYYKNFKLSPESYERYN